MTGRGSFVEGATSCVNLERLVSGSVAAALTAIDTFEREGRTPESAYWIMLKLREDKDIRALRRVLR